MKHTLHTLSIHMNTSVTVTVRHSSVQDEQKVTINCITFVATEPSGSRGTQNVPLAQVLTEGPHSPDSLPTENTFGSDNTRDPLWGVSNYTHTNTATRSQNITVLPKLFKRQTA